MISLLGRTQRVVFNSAFEEFLELVHDKNFDQSTSGKRDDTKIF